MKFETGKLIIAEGLDSSGKSTQVKLLLEYLNTIKKTNYVHYPRLDSDPMGEMISKFLRGDLGTIDQVNPYLVALLYATDRQYNNEFITNALMRGENVLLDRYVYSNIAYQGAKVSDEEFIELKKWILELEFFHNRLAIPDITIFLDAPIKFVEKQLNSNRTGSDRDYLKGKEDIHEKDIDFQTRVRQRYLETVEGDVKFYRIDCSDDNGEILSKEIVFDKIVDELKSNGII